MTDNDIKMEDLEVREKIEIKGQFKTHDQALFELF